MKLSTKVKLLLPIFYFLTTVLYFVYSWPGQAEIRHFAGVSLSLIAFALWLTARVQLGNSFSIGPKASELISSGLYSKLRHPIYYFSVIAVIGLVIYAWNAYLLAPAVLLVILEIYRIGQEEKILEKKFGKKYLDYKQTTWF